MAETVWVECRAGDEAGPADDLVGANQIASGNGTETMTELMSAGTTIELEPGSTVPFGPIIHPRFLPNAEIVKPSLLMNVVMSQTPASP